MRKYCFSIIQVMLIMTMAFALTSCNVQNDGKEGTETVSSSDITTDNFQGKKIYFAAPLFSEGEREYNLKLTTILENHGYQVFLPQRDGFLATELKGKSDEEKTKMIFDKDCSEIMNADILFMNLDGRVPDEGACVELGIAYANNKRCYGIKTDARSMELDMDINPMLSGCFIKIFKNYDGQALIDELEKYLSENEL